MSKQAISVTLDADNVTWLKGRAGATGSRSVSELLDRLVTAARQSGDVGPSRSVVGTIDIDPSDPLLERADEAVRHVFESSLGRPLMVKETSPEYGTWGLASAGPTRGAAHGRKKRRG
jgi:hypothetical protein